MKILLRWLFRSKLLELKKLELEVKILEDELYFPIRDPYKYCMDDDDVDRIDANLNKMQDELEEKQFLLEQLRERLKFLL
jgi:hypothetical protein